MQNSVVTCVVNGVTDKMVAWLTVACKMARQHIRKKGKNSTTQHNTTQTILRVNCLHASKMFHNHDSCRHFWPHCHCVPRFSLLVDGGVGSYRYFAPPL